MPRPQTFSRRCPALALALALALAPRAARADDEANRATARELAGQAQDALEHGDFARASELFAKAHALVPAATLALGRARAEVGLGKLVSAHERYVAIVREGAPAGAPDAITRAVADARRELDALKPRLPGLVLRVRGASGARLELDGEAYPEAALGVRRLVDPGRHVVRATSAGARPAEQSFEVREGATAEVTLELVLELSQAGAGAKPPASPQIDDGSMSGLRIAGIAIGSAGLASLAASAVTGGLYWSGRSAVDDGCDASGACDADGLSAASTAETMGLVSTVTLFAGIAATGVGTTLFFLGDGPDAPTVGVRAGLGFAGLSIQGAFE